MDCHKPDKCVLMKYDTTYQQLYAQIDAKKKSKDGECVDIEVILEASNNYIALTVYEQWWEGLKVEYNK